MAGPWKDALTRSIGTEEAVEVDVFGPMPVSGDCALIVCSDGLYKTLTDQDLLRIYSNSGGPRGAAQSLVSSALESGSDDNISVAIAECGEVPRKVVSTTMVLSYDPDEPEAGSEGEGAATAEETEEETVLDMPALTTEWVPPEGLADDATDPVSGPPIAAIVGAIVAVIALVGAILLLGG